MLYLFLADLSNLNFCLFLLLFTDINLKNYLLCILFFFTFTLLWKHLLIFALINLGKITNHACKYSNISYWLLDAQNEVFNQQLKIIFCLFIMSMGSFHYFLILQLFNFLMYFFLIFILFHHYLWLGIDRLYNFIWSINVNVHFNFSTL